MFIGGQLHIVVGGADGLDPARLQGTHAIDGEDIRDKHTDADGSDQVDKHRQQNHPIGDDSGLQGEVMGALEKFPVDNVEADLDRDPGQHSQGNR